MKKFFRPVLFYFKQTDLWLWLLCLGLSGFGLVMLAGVVHTGLIYGLSIKQVGTQLIATGMGVAAAVVLSSFDYHTLTKLWKLHVPIAYLLMVYTLLFGHGTVDRPEHLWFNIPGTSISVQSSELLKLSFILAFAFHLSMVHGQLNRPQHLVPVCIHGAVPILFVHFQGDDGTAIVFAAIFICMLFSAGLSWRYIIAAVGSLVAVVPLVWFFILNDFQRQRFLILFNPELQDPRGAYYQQYQAKLAIGSGQVWGKGVFAENHTYIPELHNDFIFSFVGESLGFIGCLAVLLAIILLCTRLLSDGHRAEDLEGQLICVGIFAMVAVQSIINIGMNLSLLPVIGITLPLVSNGGTSVLTTYLSIGLALSVYMHTTQNLFSE